MEAAAPAAEPAVSRKPFRERVTKRALRFDGEPVLVLTPAAGYAIKQVLHAHWHPVTGRHQVGVVTREQPGAEPVAIDTSGITSCCLVPNLSAAPETVAAYLAPRSTPARRRAPSAGARRASATGIA